MNQSGLCCKCGFPETVKHVFPKCAGYNEGVQDKKVNTEELAGR